MNNEPILRQTKYLANGQVTCIHESMFAFNQLHGFVHEDRVVEMAQDRRAWSATGRNAVVAFEAGQFRSG